MIELMTNTNIQERRLNDTKFNRWLEMMFECSSYSLFFLLLLLFFVFVFVLFFSINLHSPRLSLIFFHYQFPFYLISFLYLERCVNNLMDKSGFKVSFLMAKLVATQSNNNSNKSNKIATRNKWKMEEKRMIWLQTKLT